MITHFFVPGIPKGQPRVKACIRGKHAGVYDPGTADGWKAAVADTWRIILNKVEHTNPVSLELTFYFPRPKNHYGSGKNSGVMKESAPERHTSKPDADNLAKAVMDVLTRLGAWTDDVLVWDLSVKRRWNTENVHQQKSGCLVTIQS